MAVGSRVLRVKVDGGSEFVEGPEFGSRSGRVGSRGVVRQDRNWARVETSQKSGDGTLCFGSRGPKWLKGPAMDALVTALKRAQQDRGDAFKFGVAASRRTCGCRKTEDYVPSTDQEFLEWMADRQEDMNAALMSGNPAEAACVSGVITDATRSFQLVTMQLTMITNMVN